MDGLKKSGGILAWFLNPFSTVGTLVVGCVVFLLISSVGMSLMMGNSGGSGEGMFACQPNGELNIAVWNSQFENAGAFTGKGQDFLDAAEKNQIDPVLFASIAFHETGRGTSKMVRERNNPGGLYNSKTNSFFVYPTLDAGLDAMASNLYRLYISQGLLTIEAIGAKYAPIGVDNDPNNLNIHWVPNVSKIIAQFGGMISNCELIGFESGFISPMQNMNITSPYGTRVHPITGVVRLHAGIDFACSIGTPIMSAMSGVVERSEHHPTWGNYVKVNHGSNATLYAHMSERSVDVGDTVTQGQLLGLCGSTGASTGPHLHLELYVGGSTIDPMPYFSNAGGN